MHLFISGEYLVTIHRDPLPPLDEQREQLDGRVLHSEQFLLYRVLDALIDSFFPLLADMDDEIDELEAAVLASPTDEQLQRLFALKRQLVAMRKVISPQRDLFARSVDRIAELPGLELDERDYFRDIYDHLIRISDLIDSYRDLLSGATDLYLSTVSNRQNDVMKQLTVIATIFLPLSFITGFFGQNFAFLVTKSDQSRSGRSGSSASAASWPRASGCLSSSAARVGCRPHRGAQVLRSRPQERRSEASCSAGRAWLLGGDAAADVNAGRSASSSSDDPPVMLSLNSRQAVPQGRQALGPEEQQHDEQHDEDVREGISKHGLASVTWCPTDRAGCQAYRGASCSTSGERRAARCHRIVVAATPAKIAPTTAAGRASQTADQTTAATAPRTPA